MQIIYYSFNDFWHILACFGILAQKGLIWHDLAQKKVVILQREKTLFTNLK